MANKQRRLTSPPERLCYISVTGLRRVTPFPRCSVTRRFRFAVCETASHERTPPTLSPTRCAASTIYPAARD
eukprot:5411351-Pyramimonas_sp.AAC.2